MSSKKIIVILGATGNQGGSVANVFLTERGAKVVSADLDTPSSLVSAFKGANIIFIVSDSWGLYGNPANAPKADAKGEPLNVWAANHETEQLKSVVDAAAETPTLRCFILLSLSSPGKWSNGKYNHVYHFESKARAAEYAAQHHPELWSKTSIFQAGFFLSNFVDNPFFQPHMVADGTAEFTGGLDPDVKLPFIAAEEDTGPFVRALVAESAGKNLIAYREWASVRDVVEVFSQATGKKAIYRKLPRGQSLFPVPPELALELDDNWDYCNEFGYEGRDDPTILHPRDLNTKVTLDSIQSYFEKQDWSTLVKA